nr:PVC-type heme-binding CxxCH protein [Roseimicrobium gellanilyticum]
MTVPEGYEVRCFAHEPMVQNPVAMTWDHRGRLWVVELYEYPEGTPLPVDKRPFGQAATDSNYRPVPDLCKGEQKDAEGKIPRDRVLILEDTDNDGVADKRTVFLQGLDMACGIICGDGGVYIGQQPHLLHFKDNDGDDKPDEWRVVLTGFGREDTHELINSFSWGPDGWLYMTHGVFTNSKVRRPGEPVEKGFKFDAGIGRCKPLTGEFEVFADGTSNPWGCDFDANGNFFVSACVIDHLFHMAPGGIYVRQGGAPENPYAYELLPSIVKHKHFRAAYAGIQIYQGGVYPKDTHGHLFIGNIHDNAIHEEKVTPVGATFKAEPVRDFLRANDGWFRPVSTQTGPDGNLWIMDWCDKYPCYQNAKANPEGVDRARGRVWRVVTKGAEPGSREEKGMDLKKLEAADLVKLMGHSNNWMSRTAKRMLVEAWRGEWSVTTKAPIDKVLLPLIQDKDSSRAMMAAWTLISAEAMSAEAWEALAVSKDPARRAWAARAVGEMAVRVSQSGKKVDLPALEGLAVDEDPTVRHSVAIALRQMASTYLTVGAKSDVSVKTMPDDYSELFRFPVGAAGHDPVSAFGLWQAFEPVLAKDPSFWMQWFAEIAPHSEPVSRTITFKAMRRLCDTRNAENLNHAITFCEKIHSHDSLLAHALDGLVKGQESGVIKPKKDTTKQLAAWRKNDNADVRKSAEQLAVLWGDSEATNALIAVAVNEATPTPERLQAIKTLRRVKTDAVRSGLAKLLTEKLPATVSVEGIRAAGDLGGDAFPPVLITLAASKDFSIRLAALETLSGRVDWAKLMLTAIEEKKISGAEFPVPVRRALATNGEKAVRDHAFRALGAWKESSADVKTLIDAKKKAALAGTPDLEQGKLMFQATCAICHPFHGGGQKVGPDLIGSGRSNLDALLANVIDPNQIIGNGYENMIASTKDGRTLAGRLVEDTPSHIKLLAAGGAEQIVPRDQLAKLENTHQSLMPAGFGQLPDEQFRNLMWYVLAPPEEGPLTKEKKELLSKGVEGGEAAKKSTGTNWHKPDWESVSLWNPKWKVSAPEFERTPVKLSDFHGRKNVLLMHPFDKNKPTVLESTMKLDTGKPHKLTAIVAAHDQGDWELRVKVNGKEVKKQVIDHDGERWKTVTADLSEFAGQEVTLQLEGAATGWAWEFGYWAEVQVE